MSDLTVGIILYEFVIVSRDKVKTYCELSSVSVTGLILLRNDDYGITFFKERSLASFRALLRVKT